MGLCSSTEKKQVDLDAPLPEELNLSGRGSKLDATKGDKFLFVIIGFGVSAGYAAKKLADLGVKDFDVAIVGEEATFAYERPALSKAYLYSPSAPNPPIRLPKFHTCVAQGSTCQTEEWYQDRNWTCYLNTKVLSIDVKKKSIKCQGPHNEEWIRYEKLIVCTGSKPIKLTCPGNELKNIYYLRSEADAAALVRKLERETGNRFQDRKLAPLKAKSGVMQSSRKLGAEEVRELSGMSEKNDDMVDNNSTDRAVILGGGYLGIEIATSLTVWGFDEICLVFRGSTLYSRLPWDEKIKIKIQEEITRRAPDLTLYPNSSVEKLVPREDNEAALGKVILDNGGVELETHLLVAAIGAIPCGKELFPKKAITLNSTNTTIKVDENLKLKSSETKDVFICGELAVQECGVEAAREMGIRAAESAYSDWSKKYFYLLYLFIKKKLTICKKIYKCNKQMNHLNHYQYHFIILVYLNLLLIL